MHGIRVLLVDDHAIVRLGLRAVLSSERDIEIVGEAADGYAATRLAKELVPHVVVMDATLPRLSGVDATRAIRQACPRVEILALTMHTSGHHVFGMLKAGARGYLLKDSPILDLANAIRTVSVGKSILDPAIARLVLDQISLDDHRAPDDETLTNREREVFELIAAGKTGREVADLLALSVKTVDNYRSRILQKLHARNKVEAITIGLQRGLIQMPCG